MLKKHLNFLCLDFGYSIVGDFYDENFDGPQVVIYESVDSQKRIECSISPSYFGCSLRRMEDDVPLAYSEEHSTIDISELALLVSKPYDYWLPSGMENHVQSIAVILKSSRDLLTSRDWPSLNYLRKLNIDESDLFDSMKTFYNKGVVERLVECLQEHTPPLQLEVLHRSGDDSPHWRSYETITLKIRGRYVHMCQD